MALIAALMAPSALAATSVPGDQPYPGSPSAPTAKPSPAHRAPGARRHNRHPATPPFFTPVPGGGELVPGDPLYPGPPATGPGPSIGPPQTGAPGTPQPPSLSNEQTWTTWATAHSRASIRRQPSPRAPAIANLHSYTEDGFPEVYELLRAGRGRSSGWVELRVPGRPNGHVGWAPRAALGAFHVSRDELVIDRARLRLTLYRDGRRVFEAPVGIGKPSTPTPPGHFWVREKFVVDNVPLYGPYAIGTADYSVLTDWPGGGVVGIHGTDQPWLVPGRPSHGCVRMRNRDITRLVGMLGVGTPLEIR